MAICSIVLALCPALLAPVIIFDPELQDASRLYSGTLLFSCCVVLALLIPGLLFLATGRPRR